MILTDKQITKSIQENLIRISPYDPKQLNPNSYNLRLHNKLLCYDEVVLDPKKKLRTKEVIIPEEGLGLLPGRLYLGRTVEYTETHGYVPMIEGRSSWGRLGLYIHVTAGFGDVGFKGYWTLEITCVQPMIIYPNVEICQIFYHAIGLLPSKEYEGKYQNNEGIQPSMLENELK